MAGWTAFSLKRGGVQQGLGAQEWDPCPSARLAQLEASLGTGQTTVCLNNLRANVSAAAAALADTVLRLAAHAAVFALERRLPSSETTLSCHVAPSL